MATNTTVTIPGIGPEIVSESGPSDPLPNSFTPYVIDALDDGLGTRVGTPTNPKVVQLPDGFNVTLGHESDAAWNGTDANATVIQILKALRALLAGSLSVAVTSVRGPLTDRSGTTTGSDVTVVPANSSRNYLLIQNPQSGVESLWINFGAAAVVGEPSVESPAGGTLVFESFFIPTQAIHMISASSGDAYIIKEG